VTEAYITGLTFDWNIAKNVQAARPMFTAGGLGGDNVAQCVLDVSPMAVDASSGMEKVCCCAVWRDMTHSCGVFVCGIVLNYTVIRAPWQQRHGTGCVS